MRVTIIGTGAAYPGPGEVCSGFLVQEGTTNLLIDCGNGVLGNLQKYINPADITDIYISHLHADHFFDLIPYRYFLFYGLHVTKDKRPHLYLPPDGKGVLEKTVSYFAETGTFFDDAFYVSEYQAENPVTLADFSVLPVPVKHYIPSYGISITGKHRVAYSSDSGECEGLQKLAEEADVFICNAGDSLDNGQVNNWGHLKPEKAGVLAEQAGVKRMLLSHLLTGSSKQWCLESAAAHFKGSLDIAISGASYELA